MEHGFPDWLAQGKVLVGWAQVEAGDTHRGLELLKEGLSAYEANGAQVGRPYFMALLAQSYQRAGQLEAGLQTLNDALTVVSQHGHRYYEAELKRLRGEFTLEYCANGDRHEAEITAQDDFRQALALAREQNARSLELRVATSRMRTFHGGGDGFEQGLSTVCEWFTEGLDTPDLSEAKALLTKYSS
jgi:predicted ATPase